ncbi:MAG: hypothetical protein ACK500_09510, partial [Flavobacteriales bacterium]
ITVIDTTAPVITAAGANATVDCLVTPVFTAPTATDACDPNPTIVLVSDVTADGSCAGSYVRTKTWKAVDACGNESAAVSQSITVLDITAPSISAAGANATVDCLVTPVFTAPTATDACDPNPTIVLVSDVTADGSCPGSYVRTMTWKAVDACGNESAAVSQSITVQDITAPVITAAGANATVDCLVTPVFTAPTATEVCDPNPTIVLVSDVTVNGECAGSYSVTRTWVAVDDCGNESQPVSQTITVIDTTAPAFGSYPVYFSVECNEFENVTILTATDNCSEEVEVEFTDMLNSGGCLGVVMRTYTATDECGNTSTAVQYIAITDTTAPVINAPANQTVECNNVPVMPVVTATDNCGYDVIITGEEQIIPGQCEDSYQIIWTWTAIDYCENVSTSMTVITVVDTTDPIWTSLPQNETVQCSETLPEVVYPTATDNCDENVNIEMTEQEMPGECANEYTIVRIFRAFDNCGNQAMCVQYIYVVDTLAPVFAQQQSAFSFECYEEAPYVVPSVSDNCDIEVELSYTDVNDIAGPCTTSITRTWTAEDDCGNVSTFVQTLSVLDDTAPVITGTIEIDAPCDNYEGNFVTATDNCSEDVSIDYSDMLVSGGCQGRIIRTYTATDECQNTATFIQIINLIDEVAPVASGVTADFTVECGVDYAIEAPSFTDNCDEELSLESWSEEVSDSCPQVITYYWSAEDNCDNVTVVSTTVTIEDTSAPELEVPAGYTAECSDELVYDMAYAYDVCYSEIEVSVSMNILEGNCANNYQIIRTFTATDLCGNSSSAEQIITVQDTTDPVFTFVPEGGYFSCEETLNYGQAAAEDNCGTALVTFADATETICANSYVITRTWTATDLCGNTATAVTTYTVFDNIAPEFDQELVDVYVECVGEIPAPVQVTATDNCGTASVSVSTDVIESDECGNQTIWVSYTATDECDNMNSNGYYIYVLDESAPVLSETPADLIIECGTEFPAVPAITATDNCGGEIEVEFEEYIFGDAPAEGSIADCDILTPVRPAGNPCNYPVNFAMALFGMPTAHRYYQVSEGQFIQYPNGTIHVIATLHNA